MNMNIDIYKLHTCSMFHPSGYLVLQAISCPDYQRAHPAHFDCQFAVNGGKRHAQLLFGFVGQLMWHSFLCILYTQIFLKLQGVITTSLRNAFKEFRREKGSSSGKGTSKSVGLPLQGLNTLCTIVQVSTLNEYECRYMYIQIAHVCDVPPERISGSPGYRQNPPPLERGQ